jgi:photosystem I subunit 3
MKRLFALILAFTLWFNFAPSAQADDFAHLTPCKDSAAFQARTFRNTTDDPNSGANRKERYSEALCGPEGLPRLIVDGRFSHVGDFTIPSVLFLYIAGWIGWVGRSYLIAIKKDKNPENKEIIIDVPLAISKMIMGFAWPAAAAGEFVSGNLTAKDKEITVSPR